MEKQRKTNFETKMPLFLGGKKNQSYICSLSLTQTHLYPPSLSLYVLSLYVPSPKFISISPLLPHPPRRRNDSKPLTPSLSQPHLLLLSNPSQTLNLKFKKPRFFENLICYCHLLFFSSFFSPISKHSPILLLLPPLSHLQTSKPKNTKPKPETYRNMSSSSTSTNFCQYKGEERCECGRRVIMRTSLTVKNLGRRFLGCINYKVIDFCLRNSK